MKKLLATALMVPCLAYADFWTGNNLYSKQTGNSAEQINAMGYVMGVYDLGVYVHFCPASESGITAGQVNDMVRNWLANNPHRRNEPAERLIRETFSQVWPCANRKRSGI